MEIIFLYILVLYFINFVVVSFSTRVQNRANLFQSIIFFFVLSTCYWNDDFYLTMKEHWKQKLSKRQKIFHSNQQANTKYDYKIQLFTIIIIL